MANKLPLVMYSGRIKQLQSGDTLQVPISSVNVQDWVNGESGSIVIGTPVYIQAADTVKKAKADALATADCVGIVFDTTISNGVSGQIAHAPGDVVTATTGQWDAVAGTTGGLAVNALYFLSAATAGQMTATAPTTVGQCVTIVGIGISSTELKLILDLAIML